MVYSGRIVSLLNDTADSEEWLVCKPLDIAELIDDVSKIFKLQSSNYSVSTHYPKEPFLIWGDAGHLRVVLDNLIGNAVKYSDSQSPIKVSVEPYKGLIDIGLRCR